MIMQDIFFYSMLVTIAVIVSYWWGKRNSNNEEFIGIKKIKLPGGLKMDGGDLKDIFKELTAEPKVKKEIDLDQKFVDKFLDFNRRKDAMAEEIKALDRESEDNWDEIRKFYKVGDYNLRLSDDKTKLKIVELSKMENALSSMLKK
jgi:uncharacterized membrane protein